MKQYLFAALAAVGLSACEAPSPGMTVSPEALARGANMTTEDLIPNVTPAAAMSAFDTFCGRFPGNPAGTQRAVEANGYYLLGTMSAQGLRMWASDANVPMVATGRQDGAKVCMIMVQGGRSLDSAMASYLAQKHGGAALSMGSMEFGGDTAENLYVVPNTPPVLYFTVVQNQPGLGQVEAVAVVTE